MIYSVHVSEVGAGKVPGFLRKPPRPGDVAGLAYAEPMVRAPLSENLLPRPALGKIGLVAAWEEGADLDRFLESAAAAPVADGWHVRMQALRVFGAWPRMPGLPEAQLPVEDSEPVVVLTLGRVRKLRAVPFLRAAAAAEGDAIEAPGLLASTGFGHPPHIVSTFSVWRTAAEMRDYAYRAAGPHLAAVRSDRDRPFHHESAFIRFRPIASAGSWDGRDPLAVGATA